MPAKPRQGETKNILLRMDPELAGRLQAVAEVEGRSVSDVAREALANHVERRRKDPKFRRLVEENIRRHEALLRLLADEET